MTKEIKKLIKKRDKLYAEVQEKSAKLEKLIKKVIKKERKADKELNK